MRVQQMRVHVSAWEDPQEHVHHTRPGSHPAQNQAKHTSRVSILSMSP